MDSVQEHNPSGGASLLPDFFQTAVQVTQPGKHPVTGMPACGPADTITCQSCGQTVHARPMVVTAVRVEYFLPVDEHGRCGVCQFLEA